MTGSVLGMPGQLANESITEYRQRFQAQLVLIKAKEQRQAAAEAARLQAEAKAAAEKQWLQAEADADTQARRKEAQDLLQRHEAASIETLKFRHFEQSERSSRPTGMLHTRRQRGSQPMWRRENLVRVRSMSLQSIRTPLWKTGQPPKHHVREIRWPPSSREATRTPGKREGENRIVGRKWTANTTARETELCGRAQLRDYLHTAVPTPLMDAGVKVVNLHDYLPKIDREFKTQRYDDIDVQLLYIRIQIGEATCSALIDCGSTRKYMGHDFLVRNGLGPRVWRKSQPTQVTLANSHMHKSIDRCIDPIPVYFAPHVGRRSPVSFTASFLDPKMAISYSRAAQKAMNEREKMDFARGQGGTTTPQTGQSASQSGTAPTTGGANPRSLGQKAMDFLMEKTQVRAEIRITKEVVKGEDGKEEEVDVWEYPEEDIQSLNELYEKHRVLFNFSGRSRELSLNEKRSGRGHLGTSCPQGESGATGGKKVALRQSMLQECVSKPGVWYINSSLYRGWIFDDNLENPRWVWVLKKDPTVKPDIYPPYDSRWRHTGAKRMEDKETGYIVKPILDDAVIQDDEQRLKLMEELHEVGKNAELAFLENTQVRAQQQEQTRGKEDSSKEMVEGEGDNMDCEEGRMGGTEGASLSTKRKGESREEEGSDAQEGELQQGKRRQKTQSEDWATTGEEEEEGRTSMDSSETLGQDSEAKSISQDSSSKGTSAGEEGTNIANKREGFDRQRPPRGFTTTGRGQRQISGGPGSHNSGGRRKEEDLREASPDTESKASSEEDEEEGEDEQEDADVEDWTRERWVKEVEQLEWGRTIKCEIRLAHYKHLRNLQQATQAGDDITTENRFELLRREGEVNEFYASQYARKSRTVNLLKDENRELEDDTVNVQKIAKGQWKEIEAAARLESKNGRRRRVVLPCRWNARHSDWEVAINQSLQMITTPFEECSGSEHQKLLGGEVHAREFILREGGVDPMALGEEGEEGTMTDFDPLLLQMGTDSELREGLIWMPWQVVETIPYGLIGGEIGAEWVARCTAVATKVDAFAWRPDFIEKRVSRVPTIIDLTAQDT
ncbi:hypothetical protein CBR_g38530 [Chara braunii]|uniref:Uncharacterized protein n=1 Tax=Chara braunii TaxID=69332 RepID=A0A388JNW1_CHABU|nr:hypothetical protein CBR_g38530 [Chara braunii]|eukprot:GBG59506.1 hypothetical protein CBR_g38530 [Chara braunii]